MSAQNDGGPAFPQHVWTTNPEVLERMKNQGGMTLRDWFAGQALVGLIACEDSKPQTVQEYAEFSFMIADTMLKRRQQ